MLGMCGRQQHERRRAFRVTDRAPANQTQKHFAAAYKPTRRRQASRRAFVPRKQPPRRSGARRPRTLFDVEHPAEAEMVWSVVGGTAERSAAGRRRSAKRTEGLLHRPARI